MGEVGRQFVQKQTINTRIVIRAERRPRTRQMTVIQTAIASHDASLFAVFFTGDYDKLAISLLVQPRTIFVLLRGVRDELLAQAGLFVADATDGFLLLV